MFANLIFMSFCFSSNSFLCRIIPSSKAIVRRLSSLHNRPRSKSAFSLFLRGIYWKFLYSSTKTSGSVLLDAMAAAGVVFRSTRGLSGKKRTSSFNISKNETVGPTYNILIFNEVNFETSTIPISPASRKMLCTVGTESSSSRSMSCSVTFIVPVVVLGAKRAST